MAAPGSASSPALCHVRAQVAAGRRLLRRRLRRIVGRIERRVVGFGRPARALRQRIARARAGPCGVRDGERGERQVGRGLGGLHGVDGVAEAADRFLEAVQRAGRPLLALPPLADVVAQEPAQRADLLLVRGIEPLREAPHRLLQGADLLHAVARLLDVAGKLEHVGLDGVQRVHVGAQGDALERAAEPLLDGFEAAVEGGERCLGIDARQRHPAAARRVRRDASRARPGRPLRARTLRPAPPVSRCERERSPACGLCNWPSLDS